MDLFESLLRESFWPRKGEKRVGFETRRAAMIVFFFFESYFTANLCRRRRETKNLNSDIEEMELHCSTGDGGLIGTVARNSSLQRGSG